MIARSAAAIVFLLSASACASFGGAFNGQPEDLNQISPEAQALINKAYADIDEGQTMDYHVHIVGLGKGGTGAYVNPSMQSLLHPVKYIQFSVYKSSSGITDIDNADAQYIDRLVRLIKGIPNRGKFRILAFDKSYSETGDPIEDKTEFYTPNRYVMDLAKQYPDLFIPTISVHPYRKDAVERLDYWAKRGAKMIKWLPNTMAIDASSPMLDSYYDAVKRNNMVILTHVGIEYAVEAGEDQKYGNPLRFRRALDRGVKVIMAHVASLGTSIDLDDPEKRQVSNFDLFLRLLDEKKYEGLLFGDISAITQANRLPVPLAGIIERGDLHSRLVNGSDYPLPAVNVVIRTSALVSEGFITAQERLLLNEIYNINPLLFDFVLKRTLRHPETGNQFPPGIFLKHADL
ncbi:MAG: amidohydrolase [Gammaproteobacteria bacterium]|nr:MAG: amidohydrolase [Gammaproteobacteria bacterium]